MTILNQDKDEIFTLSDKGLLKGRIYIRVQSFQGQLMGWNVVGKRLFRETLLGTYDEGDAQQIIGEIFNLLRAGQEHYVMPDAVLDLDELGVGI